MADTTVKVDTVERSLTGPQVRTLSVVIDGTEQNRIGIRLPDVKEKSGLGDATQLALNQLELAGVLASQVLQTGTGGSCDRFYKPTDGVHIKVFGPPVAKTGG
jgi:hypothetical protein